MVLAAPDMSPVPTATVAKDAKLNAAGAIM